MAVVGEDAVNIMTAVGLWHVGEFASHVAHGVALVDHVGHIDRRRNRKLVGGLHHVEVAIEDARHVWRERNHCQDFSKVELMERDGYILQRVGVLIIGIDLHTHAIGRPEAHVGADASVVAQVNVVAVVHGKALVAQHRVVAIEVQADAVLLHGGLHGEAHAEAVLPVVEACLDVGAALIEAAVGKGVEDILGIVLAVLHVERVGHVALVRREVQANGVDLETIHHQRVDG